MTEEKLRQLFKNHSDCYAPLDELDENDNLIYGEDRIVSAMTEDTFIWALRSVGLIDSEPCKHMYVTCKPVRKCQYCGGYEEIDNL